MAADERQPHYHQHSVTVSHSGLPMQMDNQAEWNALGQAFDGLCKVGLALTVGFSVAAAFCRVMESGKVKIPNLVTNLAQQILAANPPEETQDS